MARIAETNIADCNALHLARKSICTSELAGQAISGTSGHYLAVCPFCPAWRVGTEIRKSDYLDEYWHSRWEYVCLSVGTYGIAFLLLIHCFRNSDNCNYTKTRGRIEFWLKSYKSTRQFQEDLPLGTSCIPSWFSKARKETRIYDVLTPGTGMESESGYINSPFFTFWFQHFQMHLPFGPVILLRDGHCFHVNNE